MFTKLNDESNSEKFFKIFYQKMVEAQHEIKSTVTVSTSEISDPKLTETQEAATDRSKFNLNSKVPYRNRRGNSLTLNEDLKKEVEGANTATQKAFQFLKHLASTITTKTQRKVTPPSTLITSPDTDDEQTNSLTGSITPSTTCTEDPIPFDSHVIVKPDGTVTTTKRNSPASPSSPTCGGITQEVDEQKLPNEVAIMQPILRFLQLLCENHNQDLQNFLRTQNNKHNYNMVSETLLFLDCICGSTTGGLGLLGLYINEKNVSLVNQTIETLTEYCQGPCHENQSCIATHESNAIDIIIALILNDINPLGRSRMDLVLELKNNASKLLLAIMESRADSVNAERIMRDISARQLIEVACSAFHQSSNFGNELDLPATNSSLYFDSASLSNSSSSNDDDEDDYEVTPKEVGHNIYILCHQLAQHNKELAAYLKPNAVFGASSAAEENQFATALSYYRKHTAQIEIVRSDRTMEQIVFPVPNICEFLTEESKLKVLHTTERDDQGSKVSDYFNSCDDLYAEMRWQKKLRGQPLLYYVSSQMSTWGTISFNLALLINIIIALFYPFESSAKLTMDTSWSLLVWVFTILAAISFKTFPHRFGLRTLAFCIVLRMLFTVGIQPTLWLLGIVNVLVTTVYLLSIMGNRGTFTKSWIRIALDGEIAYHSVYLLVCILGLCAHPFFYSVLLLSVVKQEETLRNVSFN